MYYRKRDKSLLRNICNVCLALLVFGSLEIIACTPPTPVISGEYDKEVESGSTIGLSGSPSYDSDGGGIVRYKWLDRGSYEEKTTHDKAYTYSDSGDYIVKLWVKDDEGIWSTTYDSCRINVHPKPPLNLVATGEVGAISLTWTHPDESDVQSYNIYRREEGENWGNSQIGTSTTTSYTDNIAHGVTYYYIVKAVGGGNLSYSSNTASATVPLPPAGQCVHNIDSGIDYSTIQAAIDAAETLSDHTIVVDPGVYAEEIQFNDKKITVRSTDPDDWSVVGATIIKDGGTGYSVVKFDSSDADSTLKGFKIVGRYEYRCVTIYDCSPTISNCIITGADLSGLGNGGGVFISASNGVINPKIKNCFIVDNEAESGGGICLWSELHPDEMNVEITNCVISKNTAVKGGGIHIFGTVDGFISNNTITDNIASNSGGGLYNNGGDQTFINCILWDNSTEVGYEPASPKLTFSYCDIEGCDTDSQIPGVQWDSTLGSSDGTNIDADPQFEDVSPPDFTGLIAHWNFEEGQGIEASDSTGNGNDGDLINGPSWATGKIGNYALDFDGTDDYVNVDDDYYRLDVRSEFSFAVWLYKEGDSRCIISHEPAGVDVMGAYSLYSNQTSISYETNDQGGLTTHDKSFSMNYWHHVVVTFDDSDSPKMRIYINGVLEATGNPPAPVPEGLVTDVLIGRRGLDQFSFYNGLIDDLRMYNTNLLEDEVKDLFEYGLLGQYQYKLGESSPCIDAADPMSNHVNLGNTDIEGHHRKMGNRVDIGADERGELVFADIDGDDMDDTWETNNGLDPEDPDDGDDDPDADGLTNLQEFSWGTHPQNSDTDGDGIIDGWEATYSNNFYVVSIQEALYPNEYDAYNKTIGDIPAIWWYTWWTYCGSNAPTKQSYFEPLAANANEDTNLDNDGFVNLVEYQNGTSPLEGNSEDYWTENTYDDAGNVTVTKQFVYDPGTQNEKCIAETEYDYDNLGRQWRTRRKVNPEGADDNSEDAITLTEYYVDGSVKRTVHKGTTSTNPDAVDETKDVIVAYVYDSQGREETLTDALGRVTTYNYGNTTGLLNSVTLPAKSGVTRTISYHYDEADRTVATINPEGNYEVSTYDSRGSVIKRMMYDAVGTIDYPDNVDDVAVTQQRMEYDNLGTVVKSITMADADSTGAYDTAVDRVRENDIDYDSIDKDVKSVIYSDVGEIIDSTWSKSDIDSDGTGTGLATLIRRGYATDDSTQSRVEQDVVFNAAGRIIEEATHHFESRDTTTPGISTYKWQEYDDYGRLVAQVADKDGDNQTTTGNLRAEFVYLGNQMVSQTDPGNNITKFEYNAFGQMDKKTEDEGGLARVTEYKYDRLGNLVKIITDDDNNSGNGVQETQYGHDKAGNVTLITYEDSGQISYVYDDPAAGTQPTQRTDQRSVVTVYEYDKQGRLEKKQNAVSGPTIVEKYTYDARGLMLTAKKGTVGDDDAVSSSTFDYDDLGYLWRITQKIGSATAKVTEFDRNQIGKATTITYPDSSSMEIDYYYTSLGQVEEIHRGSQVLANYDYYGSFVKQRVYDLVSDVTFTPTYDDFGRIKTHTTENAGGDGVDFEYSYDDNGNILTKEFKHRSSVSNTYGYDDLDRLTSAAYRGLGTETFNYDLLGNRNSVTDTRTGGGTDNYGANNRVNGYTTIDSIGVTHDNAGNLTDDHRSYICEYDYENRLTAVKKSGDTKAQYVYDALGQRVKTTIGSVVTHYYYDDNWRVLLEANQYNVDQRYFVYGNYIDEVLMMTDDIQDVTPDDHYYGHDHLFSPVALYGALGNLLERYEYDAYGEAQILTPLYVTRGTSLYGNPYLFTGRRLDRIDSGSLKLQYSRHRYYDYETGRWLTRDPLGVKPGAYKNPFNIRNQYEDGLNLYEYVQSKPLNKSDFSGLSSNCDCPEKRLTIGPPSFEVYWRKVIWDTETQWHWGIIPVTMSIWREVNYWVNVKHHVQVDIAGPCPATGGGWDTAPLLYFSFNTWERPSKSLVIDQLRDKSGFWNRSGKKYSCKKNYTCTQKCCGEPSDYKVKWKTVAYGWLLWDNLGGAPYCNVPEETPERICYEACRKCH